MNFARLSAIPILALTFAGPGAPGAEPLFRTGPGQVALIELYTSEGCSSCPPAEAWLAGLRNQSGLWKEFVPVSFHVSYWDSLGWRDPYSSRIFTLRQYAQAKAWGSSTVYTPCFVRNGLEWTPGRADSDVGPPVGVLSLGRIGPKRWRVAFQPADSLRPGRIEAHLALLCGGVASDVRAGENAGRRLEHEFVVVAMKDASLDRDERGELAAEIELEENAPANAPRYAAAAWVSAEGALRPIQAVGGWLE